MTGESRVLLAMARAVAGNEQGEPVARLIAGPLDWGRLFEHARFLGVLPLLFTYLSRHDLLRFAPESFQDQLKTAHSAVSKRNGMLAHELASALEHLNGAGIPVISLKGPILAHLLYGDLNMRATADLDILVRERDLDAARAFICSLGYERMSQNKSAHGFHDAPYRCRRLPLVLELHWSLAHEKGTTFDPELPWQRAQTIVWNGQRVQVLSPEDNLVYLARHLPRHDDRALRLLCDIGALLRKEEGNLDWSYMLWAAEKWQQRVTFNFALSRAQAVLGVGVPHHVLKATAPGALRGWLLDLLAGWETFVSPVEDARLRSETFALARCIMADRLGTAALNYRGHLLSGTRWVRARGLWDRFCAVGVGGTLSVCALGYQLLRPMVRTQARRAPPS